MIFRPNKCCPDLPCGPKEACNEAQCRCERLADCRPDKLKACPHGLECIEGVCRKGMSRFTLTS